ncbi:hypothetical protein [Ectothiorhodospira magna]|nr:hypothetical protein [Ectothiorhodospira magna]
MAATTSVAQADALLFPYVVSGSNVTTIVSTITDANYNGYTPAGQPGGTRLHWTMVSKTGENAVDNMAVCGEVNYFLPTSANDLQTVDLGGHLSNDGDAGVLFNDPSDNNNWRGGLGPLTYAMALASAGGNPDVPVRGYLMVDDATTNSALAPRLSGEAMVFDFTNGAAWGYRAFATSNTDTAVPVSNATRDDFDFRGASMVDGTQVSFMPLAEATTAFFVTPLNRNNGEAPSAAAAIADMNPYDADKRFERLVTTVSMRTGAGVAYDRDENLVSGTTPRNVTCVGRLELSELMSPGAATVLADGGWGQLQTDNPGAQPGRVPTSNAHVIKLEYNAAGSFLGNSINGAFNNATQL